MLEDYDLQGRVAVVTGAGRGIGRAVVRALAEQGANVALISRTANVHHVATELEGTTSVLPFQLDVSEPAGVEHCIASIKNHWGKVDILVNAAAILGPTGMLPDTDSAEWERAIEVNLIGTYLMMKEVLPLMMQQAGGKIVNFAGGGAAYAYPGFTAYAASKVAVVRLTETVAEEMRPYNIQVNVIAPGANETDLLAQVRAAGGEVRTIVSIEKPIALVLFLASTQSDHISGRFIHVNDSYRTFPADMPQYLLTLRRRDP